MVENYTKLIYVAGPYTARDANGNWDWSGVTNNIQRAEQEVIKLWKLGWAVISPHKNTEHFERYEDDDLTYHAWIEGDLTMLKRCDAIFVMNDYENSAGTLGEIRFAEKNNIPVFYEMNGYPSPEDV